MHSLAARLPLHAGAVRSVAEHVPHPGWSMENLASEAQPATGWKSQQVYAMAVVCLMLGVLLGYLFRGSESKPQLPGRPWPRW